MKDNEALLSIPRVVFCVDWQDVFVGMSVSPDEIKFPLMLLSWEFAFQCAQSSDWTLAQTLNKLSAEQCFKSFRVEKVTRSRNSPFCDLAMRCVHSFYFCCWPPSQKRNLEARAKNISIKIANRNIWTLLLSSFEQWLWKWLLNQGESGGAEYHVDAQNPAGFFIFFLLRSMFGE